MPSGRTGLLWLVVALQLMCAAVAQPGSLEDDTAALLAFKASLADANALGSWGSNQDPCTGAWAGVECTSSRVTSLALPSQGLKGTLSQALSGMGALAALDLSANQLSGALPAQWAFPSLRNMSLTSNELTGTLPAAWSTSLPQLQALGLEENSLEGTMPAAWIKSGAFSPPFSAVLQPGNSRLCGPISPTAGYTLLYRSGAEQHALVNTLGSCAQGSCGKATVNASAPNVYDVSWGNRVAPLDAAAFNANIQLLSVPIPGTPVELPCYPYAPPAFFGSNVAFQKATWQSSTEGGLTSDLPVSGQGAITPTTQCSTTTDSPGWWMVDLQQSTIVHAVLLYAGIDMPVVEVRVGDSRDPTANAVCTGGHTVSAGGGFVSVCDTTPKGRYLSVVAPQSKLSLCRLEAYSLATNAALGKFTAASSGSASAVTDGSAAKAQCSSVVSSQDLATWITIDLGYVATVSTVVIANGDSNFTGDLFVRLGNKVVLNGDENPPCTPGGQTLAPNNILPVGCPGEGRFLTLWLNRKQAATMYICEVYVYLAGGPSAFGDPSPYAPSSPPPRSPGPPPSPGTSPIDPSVDASTTVLDVVLLLVGSNLSPLTSVLQQKITTALTDVWTPANGITEVSLLQFSTQSSQSVLIEVLASTPAGQAPQAAAYIVQTVVGGDVSNALNAEGVSTSAVTVQSVAAYVPPSPSPGPEPPSGDGGSGVSIGVIVGAAVGGVAAVALVIGLFVYYKRRQVPSSPKSLRAMEQGRLGKDGAGPGVDVAAVSGGKSSEPSKLVLPDSMSLTQGPPEDVLCFLSQDPAEALVLTQNGKHEAELRDIPAAVSSTSLHKQKSLAHMSSGVSELWVVEWADLDLQKQIGEGSFGKVHLAKWRETTVAVKVLSNTAVSSSLEEEFPDGSAGHLHPLFESLQKEAAMMASLRHPSIVMYLGVCMEPPAVVTEYCARGSLNDVLKRGRGSPSLAAQLDWPRRLNMALDAAKGMLYLHSCSPPIVHRDLKSPNLLVDKHWRVKVCDFNLSRVMEDSVVLSSVAATNPRWLAPEILSGKGYTYASDVYAFGIILWEFLTWQVPWHEYGPWQVVAMVTESQKRPEVPAPDQLPTLPFAGQADYLQLMEECWAQDPMQRPNFATVISRLRKLLALEAQLQRQRSVSTPRHGESPSKGHEMFSRPIVSIYELSQYSETPVRTSYSGTDIGSRTTDVELTGSLATLPEGEPGQRRLHSIKAGGTDDAE